jgi:glutamate-1-semialdehyde 2,1-aminomutase
MERARGVMPGGSTRTFGYFEPYPLVFSRGQGGHLWDVDENRYIDFTYNGLSLIHGHAYPPVEEVLSRAIPRGTGWPGASVDQIEFATALCRRVPAAEQVRFTNTGTEATMLAVKLARKFTRRPLILKFWNAYHGSYDDLEAGLYGIGELPNRTVLARFGDGDSVEAALKKHAGQVAAVLIEPMLYTFRVVPPPPGFLERVEQLAREAGALVVLDDCLMFRLAEGGSAEKYGLEPDLTCLGKWIGGGLPVGAVASKEAVLALLDPRQSSGLYHGGSFNGNPLGCAAGKMTLENLTAELIARMDGHAEQIAAALRVKARQLGLPLEISGDGSVRGIYVLGTDGQVDRAQGYALHQAAMNRGVYFGHDGELGMATMLTDDSVAEAITALEGALEDLASVQ